MSLTPKLPVLALGLWDSSVTSVSQFAVSLKTVVPSPLGPNRPNPVAPGADVAMVAQHEAVCLQSATIASHPLEVKGGISMRSSAFWLLAAAQLTLAAQPALAAVPAPDEQTRLGIFSGVQIRLPLGGSRAEAPRASLGIAPIARSQGLDGPGRTRIGEGLQVSLQPNRPAELSLAGTRLDRLGMAPGERTPHGERAGVSTLGWIGIGVGALVVVAGGFAIWFSE